MAAGAATGVAGCTGGSGDGGDGSGGSGTGGSGDGGDGSLTVRMAADEAFYFDPIGMFVDPGETVIWVNESGAHSTTAYPADYGGRRLPDGADGWNSRTLTRPDATFERTFEVQGTYDYFCIPHKSLEMVGRIVVGEPGGPAEGSLPPDGAVPESATIVEEGTVPFDAFRG